MQPRAAAAPLAVLALALPFLFAYTRPPSANFWPWLASWACAGVLAALLLAGLDWPRRGWARCWSAALVLAALVAAGIGLAQYFLGDPGGAPWVQPSTPGQAIGNLRQRNQQATLLSLGLWALLWAVAQWQARWGTAQAPRGAGVAAGLLLSWGLVLLAAASAATASRTGALQWLLVLGLALLWRRALGPLPLALAAVGLLAYGAASWALPHLLEQWTGIPADRLFARFA
ncbi:MAG: pilin glycosylation ligase domain-containing protein, partial [Comamonadaceae bacterium]|nr:pilin glycosylation ligase domain-containing protein [Comamonadaceae bacterium]